MGVRPYFARYFKQLRRFALIGALVGLIASCVPWLLPTRTIGWPLCTAEDPLITREAYDISDETLHRLIADEIQRLHSPAMAPYGVTSWLFREPNDPAVFSVIIGSHVWRVSPLIALENVAVWVGLFIMGLTLYRLTKWSPDDPGRSARKCTTCGYLFYSTAIGACPDCGVASTP